MRGTRTTLEPAAALGGIGRHSVRDWGDIHEVLNRLAARPRRGGGKSAVTARSVAFVTFEFGVDGVSREIAKYAACFEAIEARGGDEIAIHCIGGEFTKPADDVMLPHWRRHALPGANGWSKWNDGRDFECLFERNLPEHSDTSKRAARALWRQALQLTRELIDCLRSAAIDLMVVVNVNSNPGNPAFALAIVLASELTDCPVLHCGHDFYWESGRPARERKPGEPPGIRDHFFRNCDNAAFFRLIERLHPWNGRRWVQLVINDLQRDALRTLAQIPERRLLRLGTFVEDTFFTPCDDERRRELRAQLALVLGRGGRNPPIVTVGSLRAGIDEWMQNQAPVLCAALPNQHFDPSDRRALWILQPTRVVARKRIEWDWTLIGALFDYAPFRTFFEQEPERTLTLHVTGPVPTEHRDDLLLVLDAYQRVLEDLPTGLRRRVFLLFSAGRLGHSAFHGQRLEDLSMANLYQLSDLVLLPSETEGRGLPILEAAASGRPLVCSRYHPHAVFATVVGEGLAGELQLRYTPFPEPGERVDTGLLQEITDLLFTPEYAASRGLHNQRAVASRFGMRDVIGTFTEALARLDTTDDGD